MRDVAVYLHLFGLVEDFVPSAGVEPVLKLELTLAHVGPPLTFPGHLHELMYSTPTVTWFDVVRAAGWNDQPRADRAEASPPAVS